MLLPSNSPRASDAEREAALETLRRASVDGRLELDELSERAERVHAARTRRELSAVTRDLPPAAAAPPEQRRRERAVLRSIRRTGRWQVSPSSRYTAVLGTLELDLRRATLPGPEVELDLRAWLGRTRVKVPPGVRVEVTGGGLLSFCDVRVDAAPPPPGAPVVRVRTRGLLGSSSVRTQARLVDQLAEGARRLAERRLR